MISAIGVFARHVGEGINHFLHGVEMLKKKKERKEIAVILLAFQFADI